MHPLLRDATKKKTEGLAIIFGRSALRTFGLDISLQVRTQANQEQEPIPVTVNLFTAEQE